MTAERSLYVLLLLVAPGGCKASEPGGGGADASPDGAPIITYEPFTSKTWSLSTIGGAAQLSITDGGGTAACALAVDHERTLGGAGVQIIMHLPGATTVPCPAGDYQLVTRCAATFGSNAYVTEGCAYYRKWDAQGAAVGITVAIDGLIQIRGTAGSCTLRASITFLGNSFTEMFSMMNGEGAQPWCREG